MKITTLGTYRAQPLQLIGPKVVPRVMICEHLYVRRTNTLAWRTKSVGSDHKNWPPLETAVQR